MAILSVIEQFSARGAEGDFESLGMIRSFEVLTNNYLDSEKTVSEHASIPVKGDPHPDYDYATVQSIRVERDSIYRWFVTCVYGGGQASYEATRYSQDVEFDAIETTEPIDYDSSGNPIVNAAMERYEVDAIFFDQVVRITRTESTFNPATARSYMRTLNADSWQGAAPLTCFMGPIRSRRIWENSEYYYRTSYEITCRDPIGAWSPWAARLLNEGYRYWDATLKGGAGDWVTIKDSDGQPIGKPVLLNSAGTGQLPPTGVVNWRLYQKYRAVNWATLGLTIT